MQGERFRLRLGFGHGPHLLPGGDRLQAVALGLGGALHARLELALAALDLLLLDLDLLGALDDLDLQLLFADVLPGLRLLQGVGEFGLGLARVRLLLVARLLDAEVPLGGGDAGLRLEPGRFLVAVGLRGHDGGVALGLGAADGGVARRLRLADLGVARDFRRALAAQRVEVALVVADVADGEAHDFEAHVGHVGPGHLADALGERFAVLINVLDRHGAEDGALGPFERLQGDLRDLALGLADELLRRRADGLLGARHLHLRHAVHGDGHALFRVDLGRLHGEGHDLEGEALGPEEDGQHDDAPADRDLRFAAAARPDQGLVGARHLDNRRHPVPSSSASAQRRRIARRAAASERRPRGPSSGSLPDTLSTPPL